MAFGTSQSIGVYNIEFLRTFKSGAAAVALVGSINLGVFLGAGPLASVLMTRWSHRQVAVLGAIFANMGLVLMPFAPNLEYMYVFYGILSGLGYSLVYVPSHVLSGLYFHKHRSLATGIATSGSGFGAAMFPVVMYHMIQYYGWRGSLFIVSGLNLHLFVFALLLKPVPKEIQQLGDINIELTVVLENHVNSDHGEGTENNQKEDCEILVVAYAKNHGDDENENKVKSTMLPSNKKATDIQRLKKHFLAIFTLDFMIYWLSNLLWNAGVAIVLVFFPEYAYSVDLSEQSASTAYTMVGVGSCIGCVLGGVLGNIKYIDRIILYILGNIGAGLITLVIPLKVMHTIVGLIFICLIFGLLFGIILGLLVVVTSDLLGVDLLGDGFGYLMLANGIGEFSGPPLAGLLIDHYGNQDPAMYLSGVFTILGGIVMSIVIVRRRLSQRT
ncbi:hypothetical protein ACF0H5_003609 [Mactra antiquata]